MTLKAIKTPKRPTLTQRILHARKPAQKTALIPQAVVSTIKKARQKST